MNPEKMLRILMVEDVPVDAELIGDELRSSGIDFDVLRVYERDRLIEAFEAFRPDIVLSDYRLPAFDGMEVLAIARKLAPDVPFIFVTGALGEDHAVELMKRGATDFVLKDRLSRLPLCVKRALQETEERRHRRQAEAELEGYRHHLEELVKERTGQLEAANAQLRVEIVERRQMEQALQQANELLEHRVQERTAELRKVLEDLQEEIAHRLEAEDRRRQAELEVLEAAEREQQRIGRNLHDSIQGSLAGTVMMLQSLNTRLDRMTPEYDQVVDKITQVLKETLRQTRELARSLCPVDLAGEGLPKALEQLAMTTTSLFRVQCDWQCSELAELPEAKTALHLYYISNEAVNNALKHARATRIAIRLQAGPCGLTLTIEDDGVGLPSGPPAGGMGLRTMEYRASAIGAVLRILGAENAGTLVECFWPYRRESLDKACA
jgi:signal transduction histidine kinase